MCESWVEKSNYNSVTFACLHLIYFLSAVHSNLGANVYVKVTRTLWKTLRFTLEKTTLTAELFRSFAHWCLDSVSHWFYWMKCITTRNAANQEQPHTSDKAACSARPQHCLRYGQVVRTGSIKSDRGPWLTNWTLVFTGDVNIVCKGRQLPLPNLKQNCAWKSIKCFLQWFWRTCHFKWC